MLTASFFEEDEDDDDEQRLMDDEEKSDEDYCDVILKNRDRIFRLQFLRQTSVEWKEIRR